MRLFGVTRRLTDQVVIVTGASRSLGVATALGFGRRGARVVLAARGRERLEQVSSQIQALGGRALVCPADVTDLLQVQSAASQVLATWGRVDVLVNIAGLKCEGSVEDTPWAAWEETLRVNYLGAVAWCRAVLPVMRRQGRGHIINVSSVLGKRATPLRGAYSASKAALNALTDALRVECRGWGVEVTLVCPGRLTDAQGGGGRFEMGMDQAAESIVRCAERPRRELVLGLPARVLSGLSVVAPGLVDRILSRVRSDPPR